MNELLHATQIKLTNRILSKGSQKQKMAYCMIQFDLSQKQVSSSMVRRFTIVIIFGEESD